MIAEMKRKIVQSIKAAGSKLFVPSEKHQSISVGNVGNGRNNQSKIKYFEIFGYDFMLDSLKNVWLIEVNTNPCLEISNKWLGEIVPRMLDDAFKLTIDRLFSNKGKEGEYSVRGY